MNAYLVESVIGIFALDETGTIIAYGLFGRNKAEVVNKLQSLREGRPIDELSRVLQEISGKFDSILTDQENLRRTVAALWGGECSIEQGCKVINEFRKQS